MFKEKIIGSLLSANSFPKTSSPGSTATCTFFARKESILRVKGFKSELRRFEDLDFVIRALINKVPIIRSESILVHQNNTIEREKSYSRDYELVLIDIHKDWFFRICRLFYMISFSTQISPDINCTTTTYTKVILSISITCIIPKF